MERERGLVSRFINPAIGPSEIGEVSRSACQPVIGSGATRFCFHSGLKLLLACVRPPAPIVAAFLAVIQLLTSGVLGPQLRCFDSDGTVCAELAAFRCCDGAEQEANGSDLDCDRVCSDCQSTDGQPVAKSPGCSCIDVLDPTDVATSNRGTDDNTRPVVQAFPVAFVPPSLTLPVFEASLHVAAFLPHGHAPPRLHLATIVLRI